jgi:hypothetical protein
MTQHGIWPARRKTATDESNNSITEKYPKIYKPNRGVVLDKIHQESANELETNRGYNENLKSDGSTSQRHNKMEMTLTTKNLKFLLHKIRQDSITTTEVTAIPPSFDWNKKN